MKQSVLKTASLTAQGPRRKTVKNEVFILPNSQSILDRAQDPKRMFGNGVLDARFLGSEYSARKDLPLRNTTQMRRGGDRTNVPTVPKIIFWV